MNFNEWVFEEALTMIPLEGKTYVCTDGPHRGEEIDAETLKACIKKKCMYLGVVVE